MYEQKLDRVLIELDSLQGQELDNVLGGYIDLALNCAVDGIEINYVCHNENKRQIKAEPTK
jgi:hypothetical protein